jgi:hypothetical protein
MSEAQAGNRNRDENSMDVLFLQSADKHANSHSWLA